MSSDVPISLTAMEARSHSPDASERFTLSAGRLSVPAGAEYGVRFVKETALSASPLLVDPPTLTRLLSMLAKVGFTSIPPDAS